MGRGEEREQKFLENMPGRKLYHLGSFNTEVMTTKKDNNKKALNY